MVEMGKSMGKGKQNWLGFFRGPFEGFGVVLL